MKNLYINNLSIISSDNKRIINGVDHSFTSGSIYGIYGKGGIGKTTLAYAISGIIPHFLNYIKEGKILLDDIEINNIKKDQLGEHIGIVFQNPDYQLFFHKVNMELKNESIDIDNIMKIFNIEHLLNRQVDTLSYGEKKMVILLSNIMLSPEILILDEVFSSLDDHYTKIIMDFLKKWLNNENLIFVLENEKDKLPKNIKKIDFEEILNGS